MTISPVSVGAAVTPAVIKTYISHYTNRSSRRQKPTAHISYDEGLNLIRSFLEYASHHTVEELQAFTSQWVPNPTWVRTESVTIPQEDISKAVDNLIIQLGPQGVEEVGGKQWWQWRRRNVDLKAEWVEMKADYNARKQLGEKSKRVMLYVHGGAYFFGSVDEHRYQLQRHARKLKARVLAPRYRLAPQFPFPCGLLDCLATYFYLLSVHDKTEIVLAGDSAGGGMVVSMLCLLRDQGLPLPAGAILISPWVDLTHSFPSVAENNRFDYIPAHGFMQKPSVSWPPPNDDEMDAIRRGAGKDLIKGRNRLEKREVEREAAQGFVIKDATDAHNQSSDVAVDDSADHLNVPTQNKSRAMSDVPGPQRHLQIEINGRLIELKDQIQMYATNQLISHPLVSPVLQPSLGGLPPLLILTGGGEMLRDEQIYLAHKAAYPERYHLGEEYRHRYDPDDKLLKKYKPTPVQLQVWEDLCHVAPTLSFTRPAKFMYRSVAQFGAWALARAQNTDIEIVDDDDISIISTDSDASHKRKEKNTSSNATGVVGKAGDPLPPFKHHMIRQRVDRHGNTYPLEDVSQLAALQLNANEVGVIKIGPVKKWMDAKIEWDTKYARIKRKVQKRRIADLVKGGDHAFEGEFPPPSALAGRRKDEDLMTTAPKKSYWMAIWSGWGSKHDKDTIQREEEMIGNDKDERPQVQVNGTAVDDDAKESRSSTSLQKPESKSRSRSRNRRRLTVVSNTGQLEGESRIPTAVLAEPSNMPTSTETDEREMPLTTTSNDTTETHLTPMFLPKFKLPPHLRNDSKDTSDAASVMTGHSAVAPDNASTRAVFSAAGISREKTDHGYFPRNTGNDARPLTADTLSDGFSVIKDDQRSAFGGADTPHSRRSVERLMSHQTDVDGASIAGTENSAGPSNLGLIAPHGPMRNASSMAIVQHEGTVDIVEGGVADPQVVDKAEQAAGSRNIALIVPSGPERNASSMAIFQQEGTVDIVKGGVADPHVIDDGETTPTLEKGSQTPVQQHNGSTSTTQAIKVVEAGEVKLERPGMYDREASDFQTAMEHL